MPDNDKQSGPTNPERIELSSQLLEAVLANRSKTLKPIAEMLGGLYTNLLVYGVPEQLAAACVLKMLDGILAQWLFFQKGGAMHAQPDPSGDKDPNV